MWLHVCYNIYGIMQYDVVNKTCWWFCKIRRSVHEIDSALVKAFTSSCRDKLYDGSSSVVTSNHIQPILRSLGWRGRIANYFQACRLHGSVFLLSLATQRHATRRWKRCPLNTLENYVFMSFAQCSVAPIAIAMKRCYRSDSYLKLSLFQRSSAQRSAGGNRP